MPAKLVLATAVPGAAQASTAAPIAISLAFFMPAHPTCADRTRAMPDDRVLLITGASTGIGAATARHASQAGWRVVLAARSEDKLTSLADELGGSGRAIAQRCDVTVWEDQEALVRAALDAFGE